MVYSTKHARLPQSQEPNARKRKQGDFIMYLSGLAGANSGEVTDVRLVAIADIASIAAQTQKPQLCS
jgi:hypothetical protein